MSDPQIIMGGDVGRHNASERSQERLSQARTYKDLSTVCIVPTRGQIPAQVVESWMGMASPMNQKFVRLFITGLEVGAAYSAGVETILSHPELSKWKYLLTLEEDNIPPPDGLLRLYESIDGYAAVGGLYWTKGEEGQPMIYGDRTEPMNFIPQVPQPDSVQDCWGLGMGFTLFDLEVFRDERLDRPFFKTIQTFDPTGQKAATQDLDFFGRIGKLGHKVACDTRVKVGHFDINEGIVW